MTKKRKTPHVRPSDDALKAATVAAVDLYDAVSEVDGRLDVAMSLLNLVEDEQGIGSGPWTMRVAMEIAEDAHQKLLDAKLAYSRHQESERAR
jgi:hypothetical protein